MLDALLARFTGADAPPCLVATGCEARLAGDLAALAINPAAAVAVAAAAEDGDDFWGRGPDDWRSYFRPYVVRDGMLQIPVKGALLASCSIAYGSYVTGYGYISRAFDRGVADANVRGIAFMVDTYGGHVAENFDLVDKIHAARGRKPIRAFAHEHAYSAGYSIASAADRIVVSRTGGVGSIGVVTAHRDVSAAMTAAGVKVTFIHFGARKVDGNAYEPLPEDVRKRMQARIDELGGVFVSTVARNRGMSEDAVLATEAGTYTASAAVEAGLADAIGSLEDAVSAFAADLNSPQPEEETMSISQEAHDAAVARARAEGNTEGAAAAYARIAAVAGSDKVEGRVAAAVDMAVNSPGMPAEAVVAFVEKHVPKAAAPAGSAAAGGSRLDALVPDPGVLAEGGKGAEPDALAGLAAAVGASGGR